MSTERRSQRALERAVRVSPPRGLLRALLAIPGNDRVGRRSRRWLAAPAALVAVAVVTLVLAPDPREPAPDLEIARDAEAQAAIRDFTIAMVYLQKSTEIAGQHAGNELGNGLLGALARSREALSDSENGG